MRGDNREAYEPANDVCACVYGSGNTKMGYMSHLDKDEREGMSASVLKNEMGQLWKKGEWEDASRYGSCVFES